MKKIVLTLSFGSIVAFSSLAQKKNVTDAAMIMNKYNPMMGLEPAKKSVNEAKGFIDLAAANPETAEDMKMHLYRGMVYYALIEVAGMEAMTGKTPDTAAMRTYEEISKASFKKVLNDPKKSKTSDAQNFINMFSEKYFEMGAQAFNSKNIEQATQLFLGAYSVKKFIFEEYSEASKYTLISLKYTSDSLIDRKEFDKALKLAEMVLNEMPNNVEVLIVLSEINLFKGDFVNAEKYITQAINLNPKNKNLHYALGSAYMDLKQYEKAEESLRNALEIDPDYSNAQYQLGAHLLNWGQELQNELNSLDYKNPKYNELKKQSDEILLRGAIILEKYIVKNSNEVIIMKNLSEIYFRLGDSEKYDQYKKLSEAATYFNSGDFEKGLGILKELLNKYPTYSQGLRIFGLNSIKYSEIITKELDKSPQIENKKIELINQGCIALEKYVEINTIEKEILEIISASYTRLGDTEKAAQFKKRADAIK